jgi:hypothetical protein
MPLWDVTEGHESALATAKTGIREMAGNTTFRSLGSSTESYHLLIFYSSQNTFIRQ